MGGTRYFADLTMPSPSENELVALAAVFFAFLFVPFWSFYSAIDHAVRGRIAVELYRGGDQPILLSDLLQQYDPTAAAGRRLAILANWGYFQKNGDRFSLTAKGIRLARAARWLKLFLRLK